MGGKTIKKVIADCNVKVDIDKQLILVNIMHLIVTPEKHKQKDMIELITSNQVE